MAPRSTRVVPETEVRSPARSFAQSLDTFYSPSRDRRGEQSIQQGAGAFSGMLGEQAARMKEEQRTNEQLQGIQDAMREEAGQELLGVKTGTIFRQNSKYYMMGLNETRGKAAAAKFKSNLSLKYQDWEGKHIDDDGSAYREWMNGQVSEFMTGLGDNQYMVAGALPTINEVANNFAAQHTAFTTARLEEESFQAYDDVVTGVYDDIANGVFDVVDDDTGKESTNWDAVVERLADEADFMYDKDGAAANDRLVQSAIRYANANNDPDALFALGLAHDSGRIKLSERNQELLANGIDAVEADIARNTNIREAKATSEQKAKDEAMLTDWARQLEKDIDTPLPSVDQAGGAEMKRKMITLQNAYVTASNVQKSGISANARILFEAAFFDAETTEEKFKVLTTLIAADKTALSKSDVAKYSREAIEASDPNALINKPIVVAARSSFGRLLGQFQTETYTDEQITVLRTMGERHFNEYITQSQDPLDVKAAQAWAIEMLVSEPRTNGMIRVFLKNEEDKNGGAAARMIAADELGIPQAIAEQDAAVAEALYKKAADKAVEGAAPVPEDTAAGKAAEGAAPVPEDMVLPQTLDEAVQIGADVINQIVGDPMVPEIDQTPVPEVEPEAAIAPIYENAEFTPENSPVRGGLYGELIKRFTDGTDDRTHTMESATQVMQSDPAFTAEVDSLAAELNVPAMALMAVMDFETGGTFSTTKKNAAGSGATGLIQFIPKTARGLGTTTQALSKMNRVQQMKYVRKYFKQYGKRLSGGNIDDIYMAVLWPAAIGKPEGYPIFRKGTVAYTQNKGLDTNGDGTVTKQEAASKVSRKFYGY